MEQLKPLKPIKPKTEPEIGYDDAPLPRRPSFAVLRRERTVLPEPDDVDSWAHLVRPRASERRPLWPALALPLLAVAFAWSWANFSTDVQTLTSDAEPTVAARQQTWPVVLVEAEGEDDPLEAYGSAPTADPLPSQLTLPLPPELKGRDLGAPGTLDATYSYADDWRGWPVEHAGSQPPVRGSFLAPRELGNYHFGIDVSVDDANADPAAPDGNSHRVYAVESGIVQVAHNGSGFADPDCHESRLMVGHFEYWHLTPTVALGQYVKAGELIGWTCLGAWHIHLSEWAQVGARRLWVNPLHEGGKLTPYVDTLPPVVGPLRFRSPETSPWRPAASLLEPDASAPMPLDALRGLVELRAPVYDQQSDLGFLERDERYWSRVFTPYRVAVTVRRARDHGLVFAVDSFRADTLPSTSDLTGYLGHYAPGSRKPLKMGSCTTRDVATCAGRYIYRPFSQERRRFWDTRAVADGRYVVTVYAWDIEGNRAQRSEVVTVANGPDGGRGSKPLVDG